MDENCGLKTRHPIFSNRDDYRVRLLVLDGKDGFRPCQASSLWPVTAQTTQSSSLHWENALELLANVITSRQQFSVELVCRYGFLGPSRSCGRPNTLAFLKSGCFESNLRFICEQEYALKGPQVPCWKKIYGERKPKQARFRR
jgi:hypothetical protein